MNFQYSLEKIVSQVLGHEGTMVNNLLTFMNQSQFKVFGGADFKLITSVRVNTKILSLSLSYLS